MGPLCKQTLYCRGFPWEKPMGLEPRCDKASAAAEVSSFQLRSVRCQLKPLEAQLAREEASQGLVEDFS